MDRLADTFARIADEGNCAVVLVQHTRKGFVSGEMDSIRGGSALVSGARSVYTVATMTAEEAQEMGVEEEERRSFIHVENAKANLAKNPTKVQWFKLASVQLGNATDLYPDGDSVQAVVTWEPPKTFDGVAMETIGKILDLIKDRSLDMRPYTAKTAHMAVSEFVPIGDHRAKAIIKKWLESGLLFETEHTPRGGGKAVKGLAVQHDMRPDVKMGGG
jgi:hypothetical protein